MLIWAQYSDISFPQALHLILALFQIPGLTTDQKETLPLQYGHFLILLFHFNALAQGREAERPWSPLLEITSLTIFKSTSNQGRPKLVPSLSGI